MVQPLRDERQHLGAERHRGSSMLGSLRLRGGASEEQLFCLAVPLVLLIGLAFACISTLEPNQYGVRLNTLTGSIQSGVEHGGMFFTGPIVGFMKFPASQLSLEFSSTSADQGPITARTGHEVHDSDSGGQPITISCSFQYTFVQDRLVDVFKNFGTYEGAKQRYKLLASNRVSNMAQNFEPQDFWSKRALIAETMLNAINATLWEDGQVITHSFQILNIQFVAKFENSITNTQLQEQNRVINTYDQKVMEVVQNIEVLKSHTNAEIAHIAAVAQKTATEIVANSTQMAFTAKQKGKATSAAALQDKLEFTDAQMREYFKIRAFVGQEDDGGKVTVNLPNVGMPAQLNAIPRAKV